MSRHPALDKAGFEKLRRTAPPLLQAQRTGAARTTRALPEEIAFKLTNRCNLRCSHCYQWNDTGYHHGLAAAELDPAIIAKVLSATQQVHSNVFLWGGEPLLYRHWDELAEMLKQAGRWTSICSNGMFIRKRLASLLALSPRLELSVAIDGFEAEHDALRGKGSFAQTMSGLRALVEAKRDGTFAGEVTVNIVLQEQMVGRAAEFARAMEAERVDTLYVSLPWFISDRTAAMMDSYVRAHLPWVADEGACGSWHSYTARIEPAQTDALRADLGELARGDWGMKLRFNPELTDDELPSFLAGSEVPAQNRTKCHALRTRMDVFPTGEVVTCHFFPEFSAGSIADQEVDTVWHGARFDQVRDTVETCGLMPVCAKCNLLYTRGL